MDGAPRRLPGPRPADRWRRPLSLLSPARLRAAEPARILLIGGRIAAAGIAAVWMVLAARLLNLADFADLALASALCAMAVQVADLGVGIQLPRAFAGGTPGVPATAIRQAFLRRLRGSAVAAPLLVAAYVSVGARGSFVVAAGFAVSTVATAMYGAGYVTLRSMGSYGLEAVLEPSGRIVVLVLGVYLATSGYSLGWIAWSYALADALLLGIVAAVVRRKCRGSTGGPPLGRVTWLMGAGPIGMVYWRADIWLLAALATSRQVALYGSSYRLLDAALLPALVISQLFPAPFARCPPGEQLAFVGRWIRGSVVLLLPFTVIAVLFGRTMLTLLFGPHFAGATTALRLLALAAPLTAAAFLLTTALATIDPRAYLTVAGIALAMNLGGNLLFAPQFGAAGAAGVTVASQAFLVGAQWRMVVRRLAPG